MVIIALLILLITYMVAFWRALRRGFASLGLNALVLSSGALLLLAPLAGLGVWYYMVSDWPMNIGGRPNWTWEVHGPSEGARIPAMIHGTVALLALVSMSLVYAIVRILVVHRRRRIV